jgi:small subunit ribosomal protein S22
VKNLKIKIVFRFLTDNQLEEEVRNKFKDAKKLLQMPPVMMVKKDENKIFSQDPALTGFSNSDWVFTDVTYGLTNEERLIVIRTPDGTLKEAPFEVKKRCWQIYFPMVNRSFNEPKMFEADNMKRLLNEQEYIFILDRACTQFDPYEQKFHDVTSKVYMHIDEHLHFDILRSTRHFGPMAFFLAWHKLIDNLLLDMIRNDYLKNGVQLISLMYQLNGIAESTDIMKSFNVDHEVEEQIQSTIKSLLSREEASLKKIDKSRSDLKMDEMCFEFIQNYVSKYSLKKPQLELTLQTYKEWHNELKTMGVRAN